MCTGTVQHLACSDWWQFDSVYRYCASCGLRAIGGNLTVRTGTVHPVACSDWLQFESVYRYCASCGQRAIGGNLTVCTDTVHPVACSDWWKFDSVYRYCASCGLQRLVAICQCVPVLCILWPAAIGGNLTVCTGTVQHLAYGRLVSNGQCEPILYRLWPAAIGGKWSVEQYFLHITVSIRQNIFPSVIYIYIYIVELGEYSDQRGSR